MNFKKFSYFLFFLLYFPIVALAFDSFDCLGSEPYWQLSINEHTFIFKLNPKLNLKMTAVTPKPAENMDIEHIRIFRTKANNSDVIIIIQKQSCTKGTSEEIFPYEGLVISKNQVFHGCCSKKILLTH